MIATAYGLIPDLRGWEEMEPATPLRCEHSRHNDPGWQHHHGGPATHYAHAIHNCWDGPTVYPICAPFTKLIQSMMFKDWFCPNCQHVDQGRRMVEVVATIQ